MATTTMAQTNGTCALSIIREKAKRNPRRVVLPEGSDPRMLAAARALLSEHIASEVILLGDGHSVQSLAQEHEISLVGIELIDPRNSAELESFTQEFIRLRESKGVTKEQATQTMQLPLYYGAMMVHLDLADASVAGTVNTTADVLRAALQVIGLAPGINTLSSSFLMTLPEFNDAANKSFMFADCAVVPNPTVEQLVDIAVSTARTYELLVGETARVAMLSFSTKGSAKHADVDKVRTATEILKHKHPRLLVDGELQLDAAIDPGTSQKKSPGSPVDGQANVLIFPDLDAGNIGYKLTQRLAKATATGPIIQGLARPANDLSRGCTAEDIVDVAAIAIVMRG